jgi:DNA-binding transcriptional LysR family regulator
VSDKRSSIAASKLAKRGDSAVQPWSARKELVRAPAGGTAEGAQVSALPMELKHLRAFICVAKHLNFRKAAAALGIAQPALTQHIQSLERIVGVRVFERTSRSVVLSQAGRLFLPEAELTLAQAERAQAVAQRAGRGELGRICVAYAGSTLYSGQLSTMVFQFHRRFPQVNIEVVELSIGEQLDQLERGLIDVGILRTPITQTPVGISIVEVLAESVVLAIRRDHELARLNIIDIAALSNERFISSQTPEFGILKQVMEAAARSGYIPRIVRATHFGAIVSLVSAGLGVAAVPDSARTLRLPGVVYRELGGVMPSPVAIAYRTDNASPLVKALLETIAPNE